MDWWWLVVLIIGAGFYIAHNAWNMSLDRLKISDYEEYKRRLAEYQEIRKCLIKLSFRSVLEATEILECLGRLRNSDFFDNVYRLEYDILWVACLQGKDSLSGRDLIKACALAGISNVDTLLKDYYDLYTLRGLLSNLCMKMR